MDWEVRGGWSISIRTKQRFFVRRLMLQPTLPHNISSICPEGYARVLQSPVGLVPSSSLCRVDRQNVPG